MSSSLTKPCSRCGKNRQLRFFVSERGRVCLTCQKKARKVTARKGHVKRTYGLTAGQHEVLKVIQGNVCAICQQPRSYALNIDHDHALESLGVQAVRGLLCRRCNSLLRKAGDNVFILTQAAKYLTNPPAREVLKGGVS